MKTKPIPQACPCCLGSGCMQYVLKGETLIRFGQCPVCMGFGTVYNNVMDEEEKDM